MKKSLIIITIVVTALIQIFFYVRRRQIYATPRVEVSSDSIPSWEK